MTAGLETPPSETGTDGLKAPDSPRGFDPETWGWSARPDECVPKIAALAALATLAPPEPVGRVSYHSRGNLLIVAGPAPDRARRAAAALAGHLPVTLLEAGASKADGYTVWGGRLESIEGYLGEFTAHVADLRTAPGAAVAERAPARFDLVLDFSAQPLFAMRQPPQGYFHAPASEAALEPVLQELRAAVGEFEKPRFFHYRENLCAHSRSEIEGCTACIDVCSTRAIASDGDRVKVDPHLCMGCGACATVCPSGAMGYQYPRLADRDAQVKHLLATYRQAGGTDACVLFHDGASGRDLLAAAAAEGSGLAPRVLPLPAWHVAAIGLDVILPAIAFGASQVVALATEGTDAEYVAALRAQMAIGEAILQALGYEGRHFEVVEARTPAALEAALAALAPAATVAEAATFLPGNDKRTTIEFAVEHLARLAPRPVEVVALPEGAPWGQVRIDRDKCTMCLACVGACPESALMDGVDRPLVKFLERNCVQCGLCESTCPEEAITLAPRLLLAPSAREAQVLNETQPFHCVSCQKPFGTRQMVDAMLARLAGHSMFAGGDALRRLQMCADCRVVDMMASKNEASILRLGADS